MNSNGLLSKHWLRVAFHASLDAGLFFLGSVIGAAIRFGPDAEDYLMTGFHEPLLQAASVSVLAYIFGLYAPRNSERQFLWSALSLATCVLLSVIVALAFNFLSLGDNLGRGVALLGSAIGLAFILIHHGAMMLNRRHYSERVAYIVGSPFDEMETQLFEGLAGRNLKLVGLVEYGDYQSSGDYPVLGHVRDIVAIAQRERIKRVLCASQSLNDPTLCSTFCQLRYSGVTVMPLITLCEEVDQSIPLELVTSEWLLHASAEPHMLYIEKIKRLFDIVVSLLGLLIASPVLLVCMAAVRLTSRGPVFFRQTRSGRFGRPFEMIKLRTMYIDAEKDGARWCSGDGDPRVTFVGRFLRRYRLDELPQLYCVLRGEMSFVGPRPERPEMISRLAREIPFFLERTMIHPGITGWAQVNYPYGASVEDARRKLEYDLYYMKHMSVFLDLFILLDTVRIVLLGGISEETRSLSAKRDKAIQAWGKTRSHSAGLDLANPAQPQA